MSHRGRGRRGRGKGQGSKKLTRAQRKVLHDQKKQDAAIKTLLLQEEKTKLEEEKKKLEREKKKKESQKEEQKKWKSKHNLFWISFLCLLIEKYGWLYPPFVPFFTEFYKKHWEEALDLKEFELVDFWFILYRNGDIPAAKQRKPMVMRVYRKLLNFLKSEYESIPAFTAEDFIDLLLSFWKTRILYLYHRFSSNQNVDPLTTIELLSKKKGHQLDPNGSSPHEYQDYIPYGLLSGNPLGGKEGRNSIISTKIEGTEWNIVHISEKFKVDEVRYWPSIEWSHWNILHNNWVLYGGSRIARICAIYPKGICEDETNIIDSFFGLK
jgi:hypothetical protein